MHLTSSKLDSTKFYIIKKQFLFRFNVNYRSERKLTQRGSIVVIRKMPETPGRLLPQANTAHSNSKFILFVSTDTKESLKVTLVHECRKFEYLLCALRCVYDYCNAKAFEMSPANFNIMVVSDNLLLLIIISCITTSEN
jgi:hypothetical protein